MYFKTKYNRVFLGTHQLKKGANRYLLNGDAIGNFNVLLLLVMYVGGIKIKPSVHHLKATFLIRVQLEMECDSLGIRARMHVCTSECAYVCVCVCV